VSTYAISVLIGGFGELVLGQWLDFMVRVSRQVGLQLGLK